MSSDPIKNDHLQPEREEQTSGKPGIPVTRRPPFLCPDSGLLSTIPVVGPPGRIDMTTITYLFLDLFLYAAEKVGARQAENADLSGDGTA
jgi:hypothetical protein